MVHNVFLKTLYDMRVALFWWCVAMLLLSISTMAFYPSIEKNNADMQNMLDRMPQGIKAMIGGEIDLTSVKGYVSLRAFGFFYPFLMLAFAVNYGASLIGSEEENKTFKLLLSMPIPRWRVVLEKYAALVVFTLIVLLVSYLGFIVGAILVGVDHYSPGDLLAGTMNMFPLTLFFASLALALTGLRNGRGLALGGVLGLAAVTFLITSLAETATMPAWMNKLSPWYYYNGANVLREGFEIGHIALLLVLSVILVGLGVWGFERRDVSA
jgi:ABC-2 type transport system permease protein